MKEKFFRIISPLTLSIVLVLDAAIIIFAVFSIRKLMSFANFYAVLFGIFELVAIVLGVLVTKDVVTQGIKFRESELEFTHIDENNIFSYTDIVGVDFAKDKKVSLIKNFRDRQSKIILTLADGREVTVDIGITSDKTLEDAVGEIRARIPAAPAELTEAQREGAAEEDEEDNEKAE